MLRIRVAPSKETSSALPGYVDVVFRDIVSNGDPLSEGLLEGAKPADKSPEDPVAVSVAEVDGIAVDAPGALVLACVVDGLKRRLAHPIREGEQLWLEGERG